MHLALLSVFVLCLRSGASAEDKLSTANNEFAMSLYKSIADDNVGKNMIFSPISILSALSMVHTGAMGNTKEQMTTALHLDKFDDNDQDIKKEFRDFLNRFKKTENNFTLNMANGMFGRKGFTFKPAYLQDIETNFLGEAEMLDFVADPEGSRKHINDYTANKTNDKIKELFPKGSITGATSLVLVNAIYFKAFWKTPFRVEDTKKEAFHISKSQQVNIDFMQKSSAYLEYMADKKLKCQAIELLYNGNKASMYFILPDDVDGLAELEKKLTADKLVALMNTMTNEKVASLKLPKFIMKQDIELVDFLKKLSMKDLFDLDLANLTAIYDGVTKQAVDEVFHKAYIGINEQGTEASAASGVTVGLGSGPTEKEISFIADHPFIFAIVEKKSKSILFLGRMTKPPMEGERLGKFAAQESNGNVVMSVAWFTFLVLFGEFLV